MRTDDDMDRMTYHPGYVIKTVALGVGLFIQFGVLIWGASQIKSSVDSLERTMSEVSRNLDIMADEIVKIKVDHADQAARIKTLERNGK